MVPPIAIIVQARMGSTRLPGKVLAPVMGRPLLEYQLERLRHVVLPVTLVVATTTSPVDDAIEELCETLGVRVFRGAEEDVLDRYAQASAEVDAEVVVRSTADCPLVDPQIVERVVTRLLESECDYASNTLVRTFPRGLDVEAMWRSVLAAAASEAVEPEEREHVTPFITRRPQQFRLCEVISGIDRSRERWTVDTPEDFELIRRILEALYPASPQFGVDDVVELLDHNPSWRSINEDVEQKAP